MRLGSSALAVAAIAPAGFEIHARGLADRAAGKPVLLLSLGDTDFDTPRPIIDAACHALQSGRTHYAPFVGSAPLRAAIAADQARLDGRARSADDVVVFQGAQSALYAAVRAVADQDGDVMVIEPHYLTYPHVVAAAGAGLVRIPVAPGPHGTTALTRDRLEAAATPRLRAIILNSPGNPSGQLLTAQELDAIRGFAHDRDLWLVSDEVYRTNVWDGAFLSPAGDPALAARTIVVNSLSKSHAMTGWRVGWTVSPRPVTPVLQGLKMAALFNSPTFVEDAALAAFGAARDFPARFRDELRRRRDALAAGLSGIPGLRFTLPQGGMFIWLDVHGTGLDGAGFAAGLYGFAGITTVPGHGFGPSCGRFVRISFSADADALRRAADQIRAYVASRCRTGRKTG